ncbi:E3 ubiquitin-protein ligase Fancl [Anticarsia gemmatalis]|uniref:E3 ubiquitin-protein ligase Fancl n=1 Tax=Anticarsia gemmatalis TaxID=129554 RepID=UPI003F7680F5
MEDLLNKFPIEDTDELYHLINKLKYISQSYTQHVDSVTSDLIDKDFLDEIRNVVMCGSARVYFGKTLRNLKIVIRDDTGLRDHELFLEYQSPRKIVVTKAKLPYSPEQSREYKCLEEVIDTFKKCINDLERYFYELEQIDQFCTIMEPINASFKDDYRRILLDPRTWLHVEVTPEGLATNIHLVGQSVSWHNKLQTGLLKWDHDKNIVDNVMSIFDLSSFPQPATMCSQNVVPGDEVEDAIVCGICLCAELPDVPGVPQPLCQNTTCGVYYHRNCLYQWLVACAGSRPPAFGVANGTCPTCLQPITCSEKDS